MLAWLYAAHVGFMKDIHDIPNTSGELGRAGKKPSMLGRSNLGEVQRDQGK